MKPSTALFLRRWGSSHGLDRLTKSKEHVVLNTERTIEGTLPKADMIDDGIQRPNGRDVKSVVVKVRTRVADSTAVPPLPPSHERLVPFKLVDLISHFSFVYQSK
ncbi:hypothetical protein YC2023_008378 [Brassica napus]